MKTDEIFNKVLDVVEEVTGIPRQHIFQSCREECSNARYLLVRYLSRIMSDCEIGRMLGRTKQGVGFIRRADKSGWLLERNWKEIVKRLESNFFTVNRPPNTFAVSEDIPRHN